MTRPKASRKWSVFEAGICHYCGGKADSMDHIVPRSILPKPIFLLPEWFRTFNETPSCRDCNNFKGDMRSDCECQMCTYSWSIAKKYFILPPHVEPGTVRIVKK